MAIAMNNSGMNDFLFGIHDGHLNSTADQLAQAHGCRYVRVRDDAGERHGYFVSTHKSEAENALLRETVLSAINMLGGLAGLTMRYACGAYTARQLALIQCHFNWIISYDSDGTLIRRDPASTTNTDWTEVTPEQVAQALAATKSAT